MRLDSINSVSHLIVIPPRHRMAQPPFLGAYVALSHRDALLPLETACDAVLQC